MTMTTETTGAPVITGLPLGLEISRRAAGMTQQELADALQISRRSVTGYETGARKPKRPTLMAWASVTGVSLEWLELCAIRDSNPEPADLGRRSDWVLAS